MNKSGIFGMVVVFGFAICGIALATGSWVLNIPHLIVSIGVSVALSLVSAGATDTARALRSLRVLVLAPRPADLADRTRKTGQEP